MKRRAFLRCVLLLAGIIWLVAAIVGFHFGTLLYYSHLMVGSVEQLACGGDSRSSSSSSSSGSRMGSNNFHDQQDDDDDDDDDGPPPDLMVRGKRTTYTPVPDSYRRHFEIGNTKGADIITRAFRNRGWQRVYNGDEAQIVYRSRGGTKEGMPDTIYSTLQPWQRYSRILDGTCIDSMNSKDGFLAGFQKYQQQQQQNNPSTTATTSLYYFLPETYRLSQQLDRQAFQQALLENGDDMINSPWVLKDANKDNGRGIQMLAPAKTAEALQSAVDLAIDNGNRNGDNNDNNNSSSTSSGRTYILQKYICNELTWFNGAKFDLRFYWIVASVDPVIVMMHDGYVRTAAAAYNESDFTTTGQHLTNHIYRSEVQSDVTAEFLWKRVREHFDAHRQELSSRIKIDPVRHVRNQMKEALGTLVSAFKQVCFNNPNRTITMENLFGFYGADFIIDADLDVYFIEMQRSPGFGEDYDYRVDLFNSLFREMIDVIEEISLKQEADGQANLLPIEKTGGYEIVYAGDWQYVYNGYKRSAKKKGCSLG